MEKKKRNILAVMLVLSVGNYTRLTHNDNIRAIQFLSIFVIGALTALLVNEIVTLYKAGKW